MMVKHAILILASALAFAGDFEKAKLLDVQGFKEAGPSIIAPNNGYPVLVPTSRNMFTVTVGLNGMSYSAQYQQRRSFKPSELVVGDSIEARVEDDKLILRTAEGKEEKAKIIRRERLVKQ